MAALRLPALLLCFCIATLLISPSHSQTCASQTFTSNKTYANCVELPTLNAVLHWDYANTARLYNSYLSIAFLARPASPSGWIAWGINPDKPQMVGTQALLAYRKNDSGSMVVRPFNIDSKPPTFPSAPISFVVPYVSAEYDGEVMGIFATLELPKNMTSVNHVWNVGGQMSDGVPAPHAVEPENLSSVGTLDLANGTAGTANGTAGQSTSSTTDSSADEGRQGHSGGDRIGSLGFGLFVSVLVMAAGTVIWS
ncbi:cytochrome b561 and DOMON domain-containing protein At3g25290-like [Rhododendron vialii]|uniref:cytochrome b561 and DOMON domain-containing protein At3g25290-like n=1 Tax=Rhododendron vialii TaxID=182163 RepID=UPI00265E463C|nr:cytochrome b561 and DOMON domain-containing protein At3g25290-like [Rhododendron vialii]